LQFYLLFFRLSQRTTICSTFIFFWIASCLAMTHCACSVRHCER